MAASGNQDQAGGDKLLVVVDHHEAKIYRLDEGKAEAAEPGVKPHDPHGFLHHLKHKDQDKEHGQRAPEEAGFYKDIARAVTGSQRIVIVGHGKGKSNASHHLVEFLNKHHHELSGRVVLAPDTDLSGATVPQLLALGRKALA